MTVDRREPNRQEPNVPVSLDTIAALGILHWSGLTGQDDPKLEEIRKERGYSYSDLVNVRPEKLPGYEEKVKSFFTEHIHYDGEIR